MGMIRKGRQRHLPDVSFSRLLIRTSGTQWDPSNEVADETV
jgi:hypothetical protein